MTEPKRWIRYGPSDTMPLLALVPENDDHPLPHRINSLECHCQPEVRYGDERGPFVVPFVIHSAFDGRELVEKAEALAANRLR